MNIKNLLDQKGNRCHTITPEDNMADAVNKMMEFHIGSLIVVKGEEPISIITERDVMFTIHHHGCDISSTKVSDIMGSSLVACDINHTIKEAMTLMFENVTGRRLRHLPVLDEGKLAGLVSNGDLLLRMIEEAEFENRVMKNYIQNWPEEDIG
jgi:CBS domain-containing protein